MADLRPVVLLTDFGTKDPYVGQMKSVLQNKPPFPPVIDLTHDVPPQNETVAAFLLEYSIDHCPERAIILLVVDPMVGTERDIIAAQTTDGRTVIAPDRRLIDGLELDRVHRVDPPSSSEDTRISSTFHGRDWFSPAGRTLALGGELAELGDLLNYSPGDSLVPTCQQDAGKISGEIIYVDHFGNLVTNVPAEALSEPDTWKVKLGDQRISRYQETYGEGSSPVFLVGSFQRYEIAIPGGSAQSHYGLNPGDSVQFIKLD